MGKDKKLFRTVLARVGAGIVLVGLIVHIIGFVSPRWESRDGIHDGLWQVCGKKGCVSLFEFYPSVPDWFRAVQAMVILGLIAAIVALVTAVLHLHSGVRYGEIVSAAMAFSAGLFIIVGVTVYGVKETEDGLHLSWAFGFEVAASFIFFVSGVILVIDITKNKKSQDSENNCEVIEMSTNSGK